MRGSLTSPGHCYIRGMPDAPESTRQYSDREVRLILKSAVELQQRRADRAGDHAGGMSLAELEQVAVEAGLDPDFVRRAAAQLDTVGAPSDHNVFLGGPTQLVLERVVSHTIDAARFDTLLDVVRAVTHEVGEVSTVGRQFGWKGRLDGAKSDVTVSVSDERTTLRVRIQLDEVALGHFMLKTGLLGVAGGLITTAAVVTALGPLALVIGGGILGSTYFWSRYGLRGSTARYRARGHELLDALVERITETARESKSP
jgi:hypothetical protein